MYTKDISGRFAVWILEKETKSLKNFNLNNINNEFSLSSCHKAISACPVLATRKEYPDILILREDFSLCLWNGSNILIPCSMKHKFQTNLKAMHSMKRRRSQSECIEQPTGDKTGKTIYRSPCEQSRIVDVIELIGHDIKILLSDGNSVRGSLNFSPKSHLVNACFRVIFHCIPFEKWEFFNAQYLLYHYGNFGNHNLNEWESFVIVLFIFFEVGYSYPSESNDGSTEKKSSWYELSKDVNFTNFEDVSFALEKKLNMNSKLSSAKKRCIPDKCPPTDFFFDSSKGILKEYSESVLCGLHMLYEELNMMLHSQNESRCLGQILTQLSFSMGMFKYYYSYIEDGFDNISVKNHVTKYENKLAPIRISKWALEVIRLGVAKLSPFSGLDELGLNSHMIMKECDNMSKIVTLYLKLYSSSPMRQLEMVKEMARLKIKPENLDLFKNGLAMPLKEALFSCRKNEKLIEFAYKDHDGSFDLVEMFRLIGRFDLACNNMMKKVFKLVLNTQGFRKI